MEDAGSVDRDGVVLRGPQGPDPMLVVGSEASADAEANAPGEAAQVKGTACPVLGAVGEAHG
jgi:hypothetical protein